MKSLVQYVDIHIYFKDQAANVVFQGESRNGNKMETEALTQN